jgi:hypothetical protein
MVLFCGTWCVFCFEADKKDFIVFKLNSIDRISKISKILRVIGVLFHERVILLRGKFFYSSMQWGHRCSIGKSHSYDDSDYNADEKHPYRH